MEGDKKAQKMRLVIVFYDEEKLLCEFCRYFGNL